MTIRDSHDFQPLVSSDAPRFPQTQRGALGWAGPGPAVPAAAAYALWRCRGPRRIAAFYSLFTVQYGIRAAASPAARVQIHAILTRRL